MGGPYSGNVSRDLSRGLFAASQFARASSILASRYRASTGSRDGTAPGSRPCRDWGCPTRSAAPSLLDIKGVGVATAATLLAATGDNPTRLRSDRSFAALCGSSPVDASSGRQLRHRLNRGGDRQANCALYLIVLNRLSWDQRSKDYVARRTAEGKTKKEIIRCLKRYVAREVYQAIMGDMADQVAPITTLKAFQRAA